MATAAASFSAFDAANIRFGAFCTILTKRQRIDFDTQTEHLP